MTYLLDTNICVGMMLGNDAKLRTKIASLRPSDLVLCSIVKAELIFGARKSAHVAKNLATLSSFFRAFESLPFDDDAAAQYGLLRAHLTIAGTPIGGNDMLIASIALAAGVTLVTRNEREFRRVPALPVEVW